MVLTNYRKFIVERYLELDDKITIEDYCQNICKAYVKVKDFKIWLRLYDFQPLRIKLEKKLECSKKETQNTELKLRQVMQELEISKFVTADKNSKLAECNVELSRYKSLFIKIKSELQNEKQRIQNEKYLVQNELDEARFEISIIKSKLKEAIGKVDNTEQLNKELEKENRSVRIELDNARFEFFQIKSELDESLENINNPQKIFQNTQICAKNFVDNNDRQISIANTVEEFEKCFNFDSYNSAFLELGIQIKISNKGSERLSKLLKSFCYKTASDAIRYFRENKINPILIPIVHNQKVENKCSLMAFSVDPSQNIIGFINPTAIEQRIKLNERKIK